MLDSNLSQRLKKVESDLQLIELLKGMLVESNDNTSSPLNNQLTSRKSLSEKDVNSSKSAVNVFNDHKHKGFETDPNCKETNLLYKELAESAKLLAVKLQKTENELSRERDIRKSLLLGTLELKNQIQGCNQQITNLENEIDILQRDKLILSKKLEDSEFSNTKLNETVERIRHEHKENSDKLTFLNTNLQKRVAFLDEESRLFQKEAQNREINLREELQKNSFDIEELKFRNHELQQTNQTLIQENKSHISQKELHQQEVSRLTNELKLKENNLSREIEELKTSLKNKSSVANKLKKELQNAQQTLLKSKSIIISLQRDCQTSKTQLQQTKLHNATLESRSKNFEEAVHKYEKEITSCNAKIEALLQENRDKVWQSLLEQRKLDDELKVKNSLLEELSKDKSTLLETCQNLQHRLETETKSLKEQLETTETEVKRVNTNISVLQKVVEDQNKTIAKQREELRQGTEEIKTLEIKHKDYEEECRKLERLLQDEELINREVEDENNYLRRKLSSLTEDMEKHQCQGEVDKVSKLKIRNLEDCKTRLEEELYQLRLEKDSAIAAAKKAVGQTETAKETFESSLSRMKTAHANEIIKFEGKLQELQRQSRQKIQNLENEIRRLTNSNVIIQRTYNAKISSLQHALACISTGNGQSPLSYNFPLYADNPITQSETNYF